VKVGDKITVSLNTQSLAGIKTLDFDVGFDPSVLKALEVNQGNAMKQNNIPSNMTKTIDQVGGDVLVKLMGSGSSSGGGIVTLTFEVIAPAQGTTVNLNSISATMENGEAQTPEAPVPYSFIAEQ
jgi:hypothetical protein